MERLKKYAMHLPTCNKMQDWSEVDMSLAETPTNLRDESWNEFVEDLNKKKNTCTCGLDELLKELEPKEVVKPHIPELKEGEYVEYKDLAGYWYLYSKSLQENKHFAPFRIRIRKTTISKEQWGVHNTHCCQFHGCKYGDDDCPVVVELLPGIVCEDCKNDKLH